MEDPIRMPVFEPGQPLYLQLYQHLAQEIQQGRPGPGKKLPSKRRLCAMLGVSMSTVEGAYSLLLAEGYVRSHPRSGYVAAQLHDIQPQPVPDLPPAPEPPSQWRYNCSTSAVDTATDAAIRKAFAETLKGMTVIIIAQRISSVKHADKIIVMEDGKIAASGTHEELYANSPVYREVCDSQAGGVKDE